MMFSHDAIEASYRYCRQASRRAGSSFYIGFLLLPHDKRRGMEALYAFMRQTDDLADDPAVGSRRESLMEWRTWLHAVFNESSRADFALSGPLPPLFPALCDTVRRFRIPVEHLFAVIDGVEMDLEPRRFETFGDLELYCERVASAVGLACIAIWGFRGREALEPARQAGIALQLTNILRDLKEDAAAGRVYLPLAELRACGYSEEDLRAGVVDARYLKLMAAQIERAERFYSGGAELTRWLEPCGRRIFGWMTASYHRLLRKIADRPGRVFRERVRLGRGEAVFLGLRWMLWPGKMSKEEGGKGKKEGGAIRETRGGMRSVGIVGGGLAGLAAAVAAVDRGFRVEVFEQATTLGGRAGSFVDSVTGETIDYCQHVAMGCCSAFLDFCGRTGIDVCLERTSRLHFIASDGKRVDFAPNNWLPAPLHLLPGLMGLKFLSLGERLGIVRALGTLLRERMSERQTMGDWLRRHGQSEGAVERFWSVVVVSALGETVDRASSAAARQVFADGFLASRGASDLVLLRAPLGEIFGDRLGRWLDEHGVAVHLKTRVSRLEGNTEGIRELVLCDGSRRSFDAVVVAAPWHGVRSLMGEGLWAALPELHGVERIEPAAITAVHLWFDRPVISLTHAALIGRLGQWVFCRPLAGAAGCYCQVVVSASHRLAKRKHDAWIAEVCRELTAIGADGRPAARLLHARVVTQPKAIFSVQPGVERFRPGPATAIGNLFLAGDWTDTRWPSTMEGAVRSGRRAVDAIERWFRMVTG